jgi:hypothetical protein
MDDQVESPVALLTACVFFEFSTLFRYRPKVDALSTASIHFRLTDSRAVSQITVDRIYSV